MLRFHFNEEGPGQDDYLDWIRRKNKSDEPDPGALEDTDANPVAAACIGIAATEVRCLVYFWVGSHIKTIYN